GDELALRGAHQPTLAALASPVGLQGRHHRRDALLVQRRVAGRPRSAGLSGAHITSNGLDIEAELRRDPLLRGAPAPQPQDFLDLQHRDLAIAHGSLLPVRAGRSLAAWSRGGEW